MTTDSVDPDLTNNTNSRTVAVTLISALSMSSIPQNSKTVNVQVMGSGFQPGSTIEINGASRQTTFVSNQRLSVAITSADTKNGGTLTLKVRDPQGHLSNAKTIAITHAKGMILRGEGAGEPDSAAPVAPTTVQPVVPAGNQENTKSAQPGVVIAPMIVNNSTATDNGGASAIESLSVTSIAQGSAPVTVMISGSNFDSNSVVQINGENRSAELVNNGMLSIILSTDDLAKAGTLNVKIVNPKGQSSSAKTIKVTEKQTKKTSK